MGGKCQHLNEYEGSFFLRREPFLNINSLWDGLNIFPVRPTFYNSFQNVFWTYTLRVELKLLFLFVCFLIYTEDSWAIEGLLNFRKQPACTQRTLLESSGKIPDAVAQEQYFSPYCTKSVNTWLNTFSAGSPDPIYAVFMVGVWIERGGWSITWT